MRVLSPQWQKAQLWELEQRKSRLLPMRAEARNKLTMLDRELEELNNLIALRRAESPQS